MNEMTLVANPVAVLTDAHTYSEFYKAMKAETDAFVPDLSTVTSRAKISALAYKVTRTKTAIDAAGKKLNEDARAQINKVDESRRKIREELDALADEVRMPLTKWEKAEAERVDYCKRMIRHIEECGEGRIDGEPYAFAILFRELEEKVVIDDSLGEFQQAAHVAKKAALDKLKKAYDAHTKAEADRIELERLRLEKAERDAAEAARVAEEKATRERIAKAEADAAAARAAEETAKRREQEAADAARAEEQRKAAAAIAKAEAEKQAIIAAREEEARKREADAKRAAAEQAHREADKAHRAKIMTAAKEAIMTFGADEDTARKVVLAIIAGEIPNVTLRF